MVFRLFYQLVVLPSRLAAVCEMFGSGSASRICSVDVDRLGSFMRACRIRGSLWVARREAQSGQRVSPSPTGFRQIRHPFEDGFGGHSVSPSYPGTGVQEWHLGIVVSSLFI